MDRQERRRQEKMSEQPKVPTVEEFVTKQKQVYHDGAIQLRTMAETVKDTNVVVNAATFYSWVGGIYDEIESLYTVLDVMMGTDRFAVSLSKAILGFNKPTPIEELTAKA